MEEIKVLDDGFVRYVDHMGTDASIVQAARVSYGSGTKQVSDDKNLIRYLMRFYHESPLEMCEIKFHIRIPMDAHRQLVRHRTASINEVSSRYSIVDDAMQKADNWRLQSKSNKQGSDGFCSQQDAELFTWQESELHQKAREIYEFRLSKGMAREQARKDLILCTYTELYWKCDLRNILNFLALRMDAHAQYEIRCYANAIAQFVEKLYPITWQAFLDYRLNSMKLTSLDIETIKNIFKENKINSEHFLNSQADSWKNLQKCRERDECLDKLKLLGII